LQQANRSYHDCLQLQSVDRVTPFAAEAASALPITNGVTRRQIFLLCFGLLAAAAATVFLAISVDRNVYAPGAYSVHTEIAEHTRVTRAEERLPPIARRWLSPFRVLRKTYSVVAFAIVGFFVAPLQRRGPRMRDDALVVAGFSTLIEIAQKAAGSSEGLLSNAFDISCGALGGVLGAYAWNVLMHRRPGGRAVP
jgi:hypothetical protein